MLNFQQLTEYFGILAAAWSYRALQKNSTSISQEKLTGYCREFKGKWTISQFRFFFYSYISRESQEFGIIEFLSLRYKSEITP